MVIPAMLCFPGFLTVFFHTPWCFRMFLPVFLRFSLVFLLFPRSVSLVSYFRFCGLILHQQLSKHSTWWRCLEDDFRLRLQNTSSRRLEDFLIKTNIFALVIRLQDVLVKTNIFVWAIRLAKISLRRFQDVSSSETVLVNTSSRSFNTFLRRTPKTVIYRGICLGHSTSEKFMTSVPNLQER